MAIAFVSHIGDASNSGTAATTLNIPVGVAGVAAGRTIIVRAACSDVTPGAFTATDSKGNVYTQASNIDGTNRQGAVLYAYATTALVNGDTITVTFPASLNRRAATADAFSGVKTTSPVGSAPAGTLGSSTTPSVGPITPSAAGMLVLGTVFIQNSTAASFTEDADTVDGAWNSLTVAGSSDGGGTGDTTIRGAYKITGTAQTYNPTIASTGWGALIVAFLPEPPPPPGDLRRIVTLDATGNPTVVLDIGASPYLPTRGTTVITPPVPNALLAKRERRFGGSRVVGEHHDNGSFAWRMLVKDTSVDGMWRQVQALTRVLESARTDLFFEWKPDQATQSVFWPIAGPVGWKPTYEWAQASQAYSMYFDIEIPVKPLGVLAAQTFTIASATLPAVVSLASIGGDAPALANVTLRTSGGAAPPIWALYGWSQHPTSPLSGSIAPFGIIEAEAMTDSAIATAFPTVSDANYRGGSGRRIATSFIPFGAYAVVDPSTLVADDFSADEIDLEVWARIEVASTVVLPTIATYMYPDAGSAFGDIQYSTPYGQAGKSITVPSSGTSFRLVRLGTLSFPVDKVAPVKWRLEVQIGVAAGSSGNFGLDYLMVVPAKARACSKTGVANNASYPRFISSTADTSKTIRGSDLAGKIGVAAGNQGRASGIGGSPIELPPGDVDMLLKLSSLVPDDPSSVVDSEQLAHTGVTGSVVVFPRVYLAKGQ